MSNYHSPHEVLTVEFVVQVPDTECMLYGQWEIKEIMQGISLLYLTYGDVFIYSK